MFNLVYSHGLEQQNVPEMTQMRLEKMMRTHGIFLRYGMEFNFFQDKPENLASEEGT